MKNSTSFRKGRHCIFGLHAHLVFVAKYRRNIFSKRVMNDLQIIFSKVCDDFSAELVECNGEKDHVHLLVNYHPKTALSALVNSLKGVSSRLIRKMNYPEVSLALWKNAPWSPSYFAVSCGGAPLTVIKEYIEKQDKK